MIKSRTQFYFIRHGETDLNKLGLYSGSTNIPLNEMGRSQAQIAAAWLRAHSIKSIAASPLLRAFETASIIGRHIGIEPVVIHELQECHLGVMEGQPHQGTWPEYAHKWRSGFTFEEGEPFEDFRNRVVRAVDQALVLEGPVLVVAHGAFGMALGHALGHEHVSFDNAVPHRIEPHEQHEQGWYIQPLAKHDFDEPI